MNRREFFASVGTSLFIFALPSCRAANPPLFSRYTEMDYQKLPILGLATSLDEEYGYWAETEDEIPVGLRGTLYRNGPGLFERAGLRKRCLLDGDGMVQAFRFDKKGVYFRNRFVRTEKYLEESAAGRYLYPTWSTQAPGGIFANFGNRFKNQAGVTVVVRGNRLFAFDEFRPPYELNPISLETIGESWLGLRKGATVFSAHSKIDQKMGDWIFCGIDFGPQSQLHLSILGPDGSLKKHQVHVLPFHVYIHDFFVSERHIIVHLHPAKISPFDILVGRKSFTGAMQWQPERGSLLLIFKRNTNEKPLSLETEARWMWHSINASEKGTEIVADFVGYKKPDHFLGDDPALFAIMEGRKGSYHYHGELCRYIIDLAARSVSQEVLSSGNHEFPTVNPRHLCHRGRICYLARISPGELFFNEVVAVDLETGRTAKYQFAPGQYCSEPVFAAQPGHIYRAENDREPGWLLTEVYDSRKRRSFLSVLRADAIADGPIANIHLRHHVPLGFHGFWQPHA